MKHEQNSTFTKGAGIKAPVSKPNIRLTVSVIRTSGKSHIVAIRAPASQLSRNVSLQHTGLQP